MTPISQPKQVLSANRLSPRRVFPSPVFSMSRLGFVMFCMTELGFAQAAQLGELNVQSVAGIPFRASVMATPNGVETVGSCLDATLVNDGSVLTRSQLKLGISHLEQGTLISVATREAINHGPLQLKLSWGCDGTIEKQYTVSLAEHAFHGYGNARTDTFEQPAVLSPVLRVAKRRSVARVASPATVQSAASAPVSVHPGSLIANVSSEAADQAAEAQLLARLAKMQAELAQLQQALAAEPVVQTANNQAANQTAGGMIVPPVTMAVNAPANPATANPAADMATAPVKPAVAEVIAAAQVQPATQVLAGAQPGTESSWLDELSTFVADNTLWLLSGLIGLMGTGIAFKLYRAHKEHKERLARMAKPVEVPQTVASTRAFRRLKHIMGEETEAGQAQSQAAGKLQANTRSAGPATVFVDSRLFLNAAARMDVEEVSDAIQEAEFWVALGNHKRVIAILKPLIKRSKVNSPVGWLYVFEAYKALEQEVKYEALRKQFHKRFNAYIPAWNEELPPDQSRSLDQFDVVIEKITARWNEPDIIEFLEAMLFDDREGNRVGFDLPAYRDIIFLISLIRIRRAQDEYDNSAYDEFAVEALERVQTRMMEKQDEVADDKQKKRQRIDDIELKLDRPSEMNLD